MPLPTPDFAGIDFAFRPVIHPKPIEEIDEDDPMSKLQSAAYCWLSYSMHGDGIAVEVEVNDTGYRYIVCPDDMDLEEFPDGEVSEESTSPLSLGELLLLIETPLNDGDYWEHSPFSRYWYAALEDGGQPADAVRDVEVTSELYPDLPRFYEILGKHFVALCNEGGGPPDETEWMEMVVDSIQLPA
jgi:hypothetical protein